MVEMEGYSPVISFLHAVPEWLALLSLTFCIGTLLCSLLLLEASAATESPYQGELLSRLWRFFGISLFVLFASSFADLLVRAAEMSAQPISSVFPVLPAVIFRTHIGQVWLIRVAALVFLSIVFKVGSRYKDSKGFLFFLLFITLIVSMTESASGHASDKGDFSLAETMDLLHLLAASVWGGGLLILSAVILPELAKQGDHVTQLNASFAQGFSGIAGVAVGVIVLTAFYNAWIYGGSVDAFLKTPYGWTALTKIILFSFIVYMGAFNRFVSVPLLQRCACYYSKPKGVMERVASRFFPQYLCTEEKSLFFSRFLLSVRIEAVLMIGILLCAAFLRHEVPARHYLHLQYLGSGRSHEGHEMDKHMNHAVSQP